MLLLSLTGCDSGPFAPSLQAPQSDLLSCDAVIPSLGSITDGNQIGTGSGEERGHMSLLSHSSHEAAWEHFGTQVPMCSFHLWEASTGNRDFLGEQ